MLEPRQKDGFEGRLPGGGSIKAGLERWAMPPRSVLSGHLKGSLSQTVLLLRRDRDACLQHGTLTLLGTGKLTRNLWLDQDR